MREKTLFTSLILCLATLSCGDTIILQGDNPGIIRTVAGGGTSIAETGDSALDITLNRPSQVVASATGGYYILETGYNRVLYVDPGGKVEAVAGDVTAGFSGDGGDARDALLNNPGGMDVDGNGNIYIADTYNHRVRMIDQSGIINTIAGSNQAGFFGDGQPATEAGLHTPVDVAADPFGKVYISDQDNNRIRMVDLDGIIQTVGGTGEFSFNGDDIRATDANILEPAGIDSDPEGNIYIAVAGHHMIRRIDIDGKIKTVAGSGISGFLGDGGNAVSASLFSPQDVYVSADGKSFYLADTSNHRVRFVDENGDIFSVAGNGEPDYNGDGLFATEASLRYPGGVSMDPFGNLYIADTNNARIRRVPFP